MTIDAFIDEINEAIAETMEEFPDAPELDVTREVTMNMILGEPKHIQEEVRRRFGL